MLKLSFTRDMAKYLDFTLCRGGALSPQDLVSQDKIFQKPSLRPKMDAFQPIKHYHPLSIWLSSCNLYDHGRAHIAKWLHLKLLNICHHKSLCSWVAIHKCDTQGSPVPWPCVTTQPKTTKQVPFHPGDSLT